MAKTGVLLINIGTPDAPNEEKVRAYLREFLMDKWVLDIPFLVRWFVVNRGILKTRPRDSAALYQKIWMKEGSPLLFLSRQMESELQKNLGEPYLVTLGMRYCQPSIQSALEKFREQGISSLIIFPLYPQYSEAATRSSLEEVRRVMARISLSVPTEIVPAFFNEPAFIQAFCDQAAPLLEEKKPDHVIFSFHGLPERQIRKMGKRCLEDKSCCAQIDEFNQNCYRAQSFSTALRLAKALNLSPDAYSVGFQSRLGRTPWIQPFTDALYRELPKRGIKKILVISPSFVADCLETLEEIGIRGKEEFINSGGEELTLVPSLNAQQTWIKAAAGLVLKASERFS